MFRKALIAISSLTILFSFQNCGPSFGDGFLVNGDIANSELPKEVDSEVFESSGDVCEDTLLATFAFGYHIFLKNNCAACHDGKHEAPAFASSSALASFKVFQDIGYKKINSNAISTAHNPPATGPDNTPEVDRLEESWLPALGIYNSCSGGGSGSGTAGNAVKTTLKANANIYNGRATANWYPLAWNLSSELRTAQKFPLRLSVEAQVAKNGTQQVGYAFRRPTISVLSGNQRYRVKGLFFEINSTLQATATVFRSVQAIVCPNQPFNFGSTGNAQLIVRGSRLVTDKFSMQITSINVETNASLPCGAVIGGGDDIGDTAPDSVSFTQLVSTNATLGVFRKYCFECHSGSNISGGLNLSSYTQAKAKASTILRRMNNPDSPMPTAGVLSSQLRAIVDKWVTTGTPQ